jgi:hypothetical protein
MDDELLSSIKEVKAIAEENNKILRGMRRSARIGAVWHFFYWILIIGSAVASYIYLQPYINGLTNAYKSMQATQQKISNIPQSFNFDSIKNYFTGSSTTPR